MSIWRFADWFDASAVDYRITLGEGNTPLVRSRSVGPRAGIENLWFKLESVNPSGSYKDRFAAAAISDMLARGKTRCLATSSGNTGSALAAYCAAAALRCDIAIVETAPDGKLKQMMAYGANIFRVRGFGPDPRVTSEVFELLNAAGKSAECMLQISGYAFSSVGMSGVQTIAYELAEQSSRIDHVFVPAGGGGLTLAIARGFRKLQQISRATIGPAVHCVQPSGNDTIAGPLRTGQNAGRVVQCQTQVSGLQVPTVIDGNEVIVECRGSGGNGHLVDDTAVWEMQRRLTREEGIFCEPAGAVAAVAALQAVQDREITPHSTIVCIVTGSGFKDEVSLNRMLDTNTCPMLDASQARAWLLK